MTSFSHSRRARPRAWVASLLVHTALVAGLLWVAPREPRPAVPMPVTLAPPPAVPPALEKPVRPEPRTRSRQAGPAPIPPPSQSPRPPAATDPRWRHVERERGRAVVQWWDERSLAAWVEDWRAGGAERDSLLDPAPLTAREEAREALDTAFRREFLLRADDWQRERFREAYLRNFPLMQ